VDSTGNAQVGTQYQQFFDQYNAANIPLFDASTGSMTTIFLGGISQYDFSGGQLQGPNFGLPFVDDVASFVTSSNGSDQEYIMSPLPGLYGAEAGFFAAPGLPMSSNDVVQFNQLSGPTVLGYMYGGIFSQVANPGGSGPGLSGSSNQVFQVTLTPNKPPVFTSGTTTTFVMGVASTFTATATGFPATIFSERGALPSGVSLNATTGVLNGTPAAGSAGTYSLTLTAHNGVAPDATQSFTLTVWTANQRFVEALYGDNLGRVGDLTNPQDAGYWVNLLTNGTLTTTGVAGGVIHSFAAQDHLVASWYQAYLGRQPVNGEELAWVTALQQGQLDEMVLSQILGSAEFFNDAQSQVSTGTTQQRFVQALYQKVLNRTPQATEVAYWVNLLPQLGQSGVALAFMDSMEYRLDLFTSYYETLLHRVPNPTEPQYWNGTGLDVSSVRIGIESSPEYFTNG
jgi:hypothetical protein